MEIVDKNQAVDTATFLARRPTCQLVATNRNFPPGTELAGGSNVKAGDRKILLCA